MKKMIKFGKVLVAVLLAGSMILGSSVQANAWRAWVDGNTPEEYENRVTGSDGITLRPSAVCTFLNPTINALIPISPYYLVDEMTGTTDALKTINPEAHSEVYVMTPESISDGAYTLFQNVERSLGLTRVAFTTLYLFKYDGSYVPVPTTEKLLQFRIGLQKELIREDRDYALVELNFDGTVNYYLDIDDDKATVTFATNNFTGYNIYALEAGPKGCFAGWEQEINLGVRNGVSKQTVINEAIAELLKAQQ